MDEIKAKLDKIDAVQEEHSKALNSIDKTLALQAQQLQHHIKRTDMAEENIHMLRQDFKPIQKHVQMVDGIMKVGAVLGSSVAVLYYGSQLIKLWFKL